jgi:hypothetical protein
MGSYNRFLSVPDTIARVNWKLYYKSSLVNSKFALEERSGLYRPWAADDELWELSSRTFIKFP